MWLLDAATRAWPRDLMKFGMRMAARMAMIATTISNSMSVNPSWAFRVPIRSLTAPRGSFGIGSQHRSQRLAERTPAALPECGRSHSAPAVARNAPVVGDSDSFPRAVPPHQPAPDAYGGPTEMGKRRHRGQAGDLLPGRERLEPKPEHEEEIRGNADPPEEHHERQLRPRVLQAVECDQAGDAAAGTDQRHLGPSIEGDV